DLPRRRRGSSRGIPPGEPEPSRPTADARHSRRDNGGAALTCCHEETRAARPRSGRLQGSAPPQAGIEPRDSAPAETRLASQNRADRQLTLATAVETTAAPHSRAAMRKTRAARPRSGRLQGSAPPQARIQPADSAPAESRLAS